VDVVTPTPGPSGPPPPVGQPARSLGGPPGPPPAAQPGAAPPAPAGPTLPHPSYCRIEGSILPVDTTAPTIDFAVSVPDSWNGSMWQIGGGGTNGSIRDQTDAGWATTTPPDAPSLLTQGFAVYGGDSGHQGNDTAWVANRESWMNFAYEQLKKTHDASSAVLQMMRGAKPQRSYFSGASQGGREALEVVARYGADYDGVVSTVPLAYFQGLLIDPTVKMLSQTAPGAWIPPTKYPAINAAIQKACDGLDGLADGVISATAACAAALDPGVTRTPLAGLRCPSSRDEGDACLSDAQLTMLNSLHGSVKYPYALPNGFSDWPGWAGGDETTLLARVRPDPKNPATGQFGIGAGLQRMLFGGSPSYNLYTFDLTANRAKIEQLSRELDVPADWSTFIRRGGKLIWLTGASDTTSNPRAQMRLYEEVVKRNGKAAVDSAIRYYLIPSGEHSRVSRSLTGEAMPSTWNVGGALRDWVENGIQPPDAPVLTGYGADGDAIVSTRLMCRYPAYPHYVAGSPKWASAFSCRTDAAR
jgi:feruloyl esterase